MPSKLRIGNSQRKVKDLLGWGAGGQVYRGHRFDGAPVAIKWMLVPEPDRVRSFPAWHELELLHSVRNKPFVIQLLD